MKSGLNFPNRGGSFLDTQSRHNRLKEKCEHLSLERHCAILGVDGHMEKAFYNSQIDLCAIATIPGADTGAIRNVGALPLTQFKIDGWIGHKAYEARHLLEMVSARAERLKGNYSETFTVVFP